MILLEPENSSSTKKNNKAPCISPNFSASKHPENENSFDFKTRHPNDPFIKKSMKKWVVHFPHLVRFWFSRILKLHIFEKNGWENPGKFSNPTRQKILELSWIAKKNTIFLGTFFPIPKKPMNLRPGGKWIEKKMETSKGMCECLENCWPTKLPNKFGRCRLKMVLFFFVTSECPKKCWNVGMFNMQKDAKK